MRYILLLFLFSCSEIKTPNCFKMIRISDANPIKFWINGQPSYNNTPEPGVDHICFFQPFNCEDEIRLQIESDESNGFFLQITDTENVELGTVNFVNIGGNFWQLSFIPDLLSVCEKVFLNIFTNSVIPPLSGFTNQDDGTMDFAWTLGANPTITLDGTDQSQYLLEPFPTVGGRQYSISYNVNFGVNGANMRIYFLDAAFNELNSVPVPEFGTGINSGSVNITPSANGTYIAIKLNNGGILNTFTVLSLSRTSANTKIASSDIIDIKDLHENTLWIESTNQTDFAGLVYEGIAPVPTFGVRVKAKFYEQRFPEENESEPDGEGNVDKLSSTTKTQKLMEVDPMPPYRHKQLKLALQHNSIFIQNLAWVKEEQYEVEKIAEEYPFFKAKAWLTQQSNEYILNT